jgi:hypothetical protein
VSSDFGYLLRLIEAYADSRDSPPDPPSDIDWNAFASHATEFGLTSTVAGVVSESAAPEEVKQLLDEAARRIRLRTTLFWIETDRILGHLDAAGIRSVLLKGPALGLTVYRRPEHRVTADLDVLVDRGEVERASERLAELGYRQATTRRHASFYETHHFHRVLRNASGVTVEVHWDLSRPADYFRFDLDELLSRTRVLSRPEGEIRVPSDTDQLLHAACQALREGYTDLRRVVDSALLLPKDAPTPAGIVELAERQGMSTALWALLHTRKTLLGMSPPADLERDLRPEPFVRRALDGLLRVDRNGYDGSHRRSGLNQLLLWLCAPDGRHAADCVRRFIAPGPAEWLDDGHDPDEFPGPLRRTATSARHVMSFGKLAAWLAWCTTMRGPSPFPP